MSNASNCAHASKRHHPWIWEATRHEFTTPLQRWKFPSAQMCELRPKIEIKHVTAVATSTCAKQALPASSAISSSCFGGAGAGVVDCFAGGAGVASATH